MMAGGFFGVLKLIRAQPEPCYEIGNVSNLLLKWTSLKFEISYVFYSGKAIKEIISITF